MSLHVAPPVGEAVARSRPVVALETAVLTHGLPRPENARVYREVEAAVRSEGAVPAPVGVAGGLLRVGLSSGEVARLAEGRASKAGLADLPAVAASGGDAGTTVAATLFAASAAGIGVFATGGIGGVHRGAAGSFDVSGDLAALGRFGGCVVCSGAKIVLDLPRTLEALEALGVAVVGYRTDRLPAFVCGDSGLPVRHRVESPEEAAAVVRARDGLGLPGAVVLVQPPPPDRALAREDLEPVVAEALARAEREGVTGPAVTPYLLDALGRASAGASREANRALLVANARLAARVAGALSSGGAGQRRTPPGGAGREASPAPPPLDPPSDPRVS